MDKYHSQLKKVQATLVNCMSHDEYPTDFLKCIIPAGNQTATSALKIYQQDYICKLSNALSNRYPCLSFCIGDANFNLLCKKYIFKYPSQETDLGQFGNKMEVFLKDYPLSEKYPFLSQMAQMENDLSNLFYAREITALKAADIIFEKSGHHACLEITPHHKIIKSSFPLATLWIACQEKNKDASIDLFENEFILLYKTDSYARVKKLSPLQYQLFTQIAQNKNSLLTCLEATTIEIDNNNQHEIPKLFNFLITQKLIIKNTLLKIKDLT